MPREWWLVRVQQVVVKSHLATCEVIYRNAEVCLMADWVAFDANLERFALAGNEMGFLSQ